MNKSIYKKQLAFKNSLPQYKDGGNIFQKAGAGALGVLSKVPIIQSFAPMMENAKIVENNQASFNTGQGIGAVGMAVGKGLTGDIGGAVSSGLDAGKEFMEVGSTVAEQKGNTERADRLDKAAMGFQAGSQAAGMASMMGGNFKSGEGISKMLGFGTMFGNTGGNTPVVMKNGGMIKRADGSYSRRGLWDNIRANKGSGKEPTPEMLEQERKIKAKMQDGGYTYSTEADKQGSNYNVKNPNYEPLDNSIIDPGKWVKGTQILGDVVSFVNPPLGRAISTPGDVLDIIKNPKEPANYITPFVRTLNRSAGVTNKGKDKVDRLNFLINSGILASDLKEYKDGGNLIKYNLPTYENGAIHKGTPTAELELKENGLNGNGEPFQVNAPSHEKGGVKVNLKEGAIILSDNEDLFGKNTPAKEVAPLIEGLKQLENRKDNISENTKQIYKEKINNIFQEQEQFKKMVQAKSNSFKMKNGGNLPKYNDGAYFNPYGLGSGTVNTFGTTPTESMNTMTPSVMLGNTTIPSIKDRSNKNFTNTNTETINSSLFPTKNRFAPATMNNPTLAGNKTNPNLLPIDNPIIPTQSGMSQRRAVDFGADFDRNNPFKADKADTGSIFSQPGVAGGALKNVPSTLYNLGVGLFGKVQKTPSVLTQRTEKIGPVRFGTNEMDLEANRQRAAINQGSTSDAVRRANLQSLSLGNQRLKGELAQKEALANVGIQEQNQARALQENLTDQKARQLAQQYNISAEQAKKLALQEGIAGIGEIMDDTSKQKIAYGENQLGFGALQTMFSNWKLKNPGGTYSSFLKSIGKGGGAIEFVS